MSRQQLFNGHRNSYRYKDTWLSYFDPEIRSINMTSNQEFVFAWRNEVICTVYGKDKISFDKNYPDRELIMNVRNENGIIRSLGIELDPPNSFRDWENAKRYLIRTWLQMAGFDQYYEPSLFVGFDDVTDHGRFVGWLARFFNCFDNVGEALALKSFYTSPFVEGPKYHDGEESGDLEPMLQAERKTFFDRVKLYEANYALILKRAI